jgi:hypothetical protein
MKSIDEPVKKDSKLNNLLSSSKSEIFQDNLDFIHMKNSTVLPLSKVQQISVNASCIENIASKTSDSLPFHKPTKKLMKKSAKYSFRGKSSPKRSLYLNKNKVKKSARNSVKSPTIRSRKPSRSISANKNLKQNKTYLQKYNEKKGKKTKKGKSRMKKRSTLYNKSKTMRFD